MFLWVVFIPLIPVSMLVFYYQGYAKNNILETHDNLAKMAASAVTQHIDNITWRMSFTDGLEKIINNKNAVERKLEEVLASNPDFLMLAVLDSEGREKYKVGPKFITDNVGVIDLSSEGTLSEIRKQNRLNVSGFDVHLNLPIAEIIYPLQDGNFLFGIVSFYKLWSRISAQRIGNSGRIYLVHSSGEIFMSSPGEEQAVSPYYLNTAIVSGQPLQKNLKGSNGVNYIGAIEPSPILDAYIAVLQTKDEAFTSINSITAFLIFFILAIALLAYFAAYSFAGSIANPIGELIAGAKRVSKGNFDTPVLKDKEWGEFNSLINSFNTMMKDLKDYRDLQIKQQVSEMKEFVFKAVAHDLRAPVFGLQGYVELLQSGKISEEEAKNYIGIMKESLENLSSLLENILDVSKLEAGMLKPEKKTFDAAQMIEKCVNLLNPSAKEKGIYLTVHIESNKEAFGDEKLLERVITNLLSNAIKFTDKGSVTVTYKTDEKYSVFEVEDSGKGIAENELEQIFKKYHQTDNSVKGYGLGLAISREIINSHGGAIKAQKTKNNEHGALIEFKIPFN
ncbi:Putative two-component system [Elusimicrobium minutum Pei191]|uniref:histidine kinase n=2 Tax=Elusimicrobium TaxID=423604 RepID=B2KEE1_ELUMP|nr:Putative two-component system [Elusimicrobium minutum Pei191]